MMKLKKSELGIFALGGLNEVGKNTYCIEYKNEIIIIDAGIKFPGDSLFGVEYVIADYSYLVENKEKISALIITHGHEDHIGGIKYLLQQIPSLPVIYAPQLAVSLIKNKVSSKLLSSDRDFLRLITEDTIVKTSNMEVSFFRTNHSIPDSFGLAVKTDKGTIVHTGDFKFDLTPVGAAANIGKMAQLGNEGVLCLLSDSTNAQTPGFTPSERVVDKTLREIFKKTKGRIILATFASNVNRLKHIVETSIKNKRKIAVAGRSMENIMKVAVSEKHIPEVSKHLVSINNLKNYDESEIVIVCTGSQGEPLAALSRMANRTHKQIKVQEGDTVVFSSSPIPGNDAKISKTINMLYRQGADVYTTRENSIHTSGHGAQLELQLMLRLIRPKYFMPIHGDYRMLKVHSDLAVETGVQRENCFILENGQVLTFTNDGPHTRNFVSGKDIYIDGKQIGDVGEKVLKDRQILVDDGVIAVSICIDIKNRKQLTLPLIQTRGFVKVNESEELMSSIRNKVKNAINETLNDPKVNFDKIKKKIVLTTQYECKTNTGRNPIVLPIMMDIKGK
ncbi:MAG: ribonuclease J [Bacilli bacterium]